MALFGGKKDDDEGTAVEAIRLSWVHDGPLGVARSKAFELRERERELVEEQPPARATRDLAIADVQEAQALKARLD